MITGVQLWTLREHCTNLKDFSETLKKVSDMGYKSVQVSGTCSYEPQWLKEQLHINGLICPITHFDVQEVISNTKETAEKHSVFDCSYIGYGGKHNRPNDYYSIIAALPDPSTELHKLGKQFTYHHHSWEYLEHTSDGRTVMQYLSDTFSPEQMNFTLDTYWVKYAGYNVSEEIQRLKGRIGCVHLKDMIKLDNEDKQMAYVGGGNCLDFEKILQNLYDAGTKYVLVEQDDCYGKDPFNELKKSFDYLKSLGL